MNRFKELGDYPLEQVSGIERKLKDVEFTTLDERLMLFDVEHLFPNILVKKELLYLEEWQQSKNPTSLVLKR